ncbi:MAG: hypothetical protein ACI4QI_01495 [Candidatus Coproplasma sp.]
MVSKTNKTKKLCIILTIIWSNFILASILPLIFWMLMYAPDINSVEYYSDPANYVSFDGSVQSFNIGDNCIIIRFNHNQKEFYDSFRIDGKNYDLAIENGLSDILLEDALFTITSASAYLGDGWSYPIVALTYNEREIIAYEEGWQNFVEVRKIAENKARSYIIVWGSVVGALAVFDVCSAIGIFIQRKDK